MVLESKLKDILEQAELDDSNPTVREIRLALVMNGGVSLAVWMGGSTAEIHALATAKHAAGVPAPGDSTGVLWGKLLKKAGLKVDVDVVAGTSAGGLNGALLASCLALGSSYPDMQDHWRQLPTLKRGQLIRSLDHDDAGLSVLDGGYFSDEVAKIFQDIENRSDGKNARDMTCLVTATAIGGDPRHVVDDFGARQTASDHRRVYRFTNQKLHYSYSPETGVMPDSLTQFANSSAVAAAARASSGFPVAFQPVREGPELVRLRKVGQGPPTWLMDGGVLDNAAFEPLLDVVRERPVDGPWVRVLAYLVPSSADPVRSPQDGASPMPDLAQILGAVVGTSRETDSRLDLDALTEYRRRSGASVMRPESLLRSVRTSAAPPAWLAAADGLLLLYVESQIREITSAQTQSVARITSRMFQAPEDSAVARCRRAQALRFIPDTIDASPERDWDWGIGTAQRLLRWWARDLNTMTRPPAREIASLGQLQAIMLSVAEAAEVVRLGMAETDLDENAMKAMSPDERANHRLTMAERWAEDPVTIECLAMAGELAHYGSRIYAAALGAEEDTIEASAQGWLDIALRVEVLIHATVCETDMHDYPKLKFLRMGPDIESPAVPDDDEVRRHRDWGTRKLYGSTLGHFGAFAEADWRTADWTWGRLDAAKHLVRLIASEARAGSLSEAEEEEWVLTIQRRILSDESTDMDRWHNRVRKSFEHNGIDNEAVLNKMRADEGGQQELRAIFDEMLTVIAKVGSTRPGRMRDVTEDLREKLYLEKDRPQDLRPELLDRFLGEYFRGKIEDWIQLRD